MNGSTKKYKHPHASRSTSTSSAVSVKSESSNSITNSDIIDEYLAPSAKGPGPDSSSTRQINLNRNKYNEKGSKSKDEEKAAARARRFATPSTPINANSYGFVSRGEDNRLQKYHRERQKFFNMILLSFIKYCNSNSTHSLSKSIDRLINRSEVVEEEEEENEDEKSNQKEKAVGLDSILSSLRKLREALLYIDHSSSANNIKDKEVEQFTKKVYLFSVRLSSNIGHYQTYIPSINHLIHNKNLLTDDEFEEISILLILHLLHFNNLTSKAIKIYFGSKLNNRKSNDSIKLWQIIQSWIQQDYVRWFKLFHSEKDSCKVTIMKFGYDKIIKHTLEVINQSYFTILEKDLYNDVLQQEYIASKCDINDIIDKYKLSWKVQDSEKAHNRLVIVKERRRV
ncbi:uncharacterized protein RJT21DRAFT_50600 [Scheffersomyces amazonensis]|uniref:uncharacterized protein n=1 Tax=Scheffersomyces amazonensis TaxID=1078765 RepID=UPI00315DC18B